MGNLRSLGTASPGPSSPLGAPTRAPGWVGSALALARRRAGARVVVRCVPRVCVARDVTAIGPTPITHGVEPHQASFRGPEPEGTGPGPRAPHLRLRHGIRHHDAVLVDP